MIHGSWNISCNRQKFLSFWAIFCPFSPLTTWKIKILKLKKTPRDVIILHICTINGNYMIYGSWDMECNRQNVLSFWTVFCPFTPSGSRKPKFLKYEKNTGTHYHFTNVYHKWQSYDVLFLRYGVQRIYFFIILDRFLPFYPLQQPENQHFEKMKKMLGDIIILHMRTKNKNHMMYSIFIV